ncbi:bifunctional protein tyrosine phosphatase family protein/NAD(P)/FAD-dependent oxidoreductase [Marinobacter sp.]|uniref:bifunctional protein tyrosine phosphatase family protein/NAD(P)/FAD-dependent oxidoreductase n=1 Tax=Marinobacter sp. TaxID=50741 RepID=UPI0019A933DF|nr:bifunctional protein tyrosine phosphatase family protein/NAD(P)/FAD-dependent oxidoreductase [Marinobacter sp.]MBD3656238.1 TIGR01244 family phosphatase [Marinobacter sp.]
MDVRQLTPFLSVSPQMTAADVGLAASMGFKAIICNRPDQESHDQPANDEIRAAAERHGLIWHYQPVISGQITDEDVVRFREMMQTLHGPVLAFCRTGSRCSTLWALAEAPRLDVEAILKTTAAAGYDLTAQRDRIQGLATSPGQQGAGRAGGGSGKLHDVLIIGGGAAGQSVAGSLLRRQPGLDIAIVEPRSEHYYQPGWTLVGGGVFERAETMRRMVDVMPREVHWYQAAASAFTPEQRQVVLEDGEKIGYRILVVAPGLTLDWDAIPGLRETLGRNGVTSNYLFDLAPYTWELVQNTRKGRAIFTQPAMPIKCAGAPQKAMYLSCDHWNRKGWLNNLDVEFCTAGAALFGVADYVPALQEYVGKYGINVNFQNNLIKVDGDARTAVFRVTDGEGNTSEVEKTFDMLHVCPPQRAPKFISESPLADAAGWIDLNPETLQHARYGDIFGLGDAGNTPNAKTAAAVRKQAPVVAENVLLALKGEAPKAIYDGYGSCPLTVERGKIVLAEFGYGGKLQPSFPSWLVEGTRPSRFAWLLKEKMLPWIYWNAMLKGHEWMAGPEILAHRPADHEVGEACDFGGRKP